MLIFLFFIICTSFFSIFAVANPKSMTLSKQQKTMLRQCKFLKDYDDNKIIPNHPLWLGEYLWVKEKGEISDKKHNYAKMQVSKVSGFDSVLFALKVFIFEACEHLAIQHSFRTPSDSEILESFVRNMRLYTDSE